MKKTILLIAAISLGAALVGCGKKEDDSSGATGTTTSGVKDKTPKTGDE